VDNSGRENGKLSAPSGSTSSFRAAAAMPLGALRSLDAPRQSGLLVLVSGTLRQEQGRKVLDDAMLCKWGGGSAAD
jgi:hypothetical protein